MADTGRRGPLAPISPALRDDAQASDQQTESKMRRALGLGAGGGHHTPQQRPEQARARHRFVQDGGVPVVMLSQKTEPEVTQLRERIASLEAALETERQAHQSVLRLLKETEAHHTATQTRLAHAELAHRDAIEQERRLRITAQEALAEALAAVPAPRRRVAAPVATIAAPAATAANDAEQPAGAAPRLQAAPISAEAPPKRGRGRPRSTTPPEPKPVRWWTPSFKAKGKS